MILLSNQYFLEDMETLPNYRVIYEDLRGQIADGTFTPGDLLPSENEICTRYNVARLTARKALGQLEGDGLIIRRQGKGSIVKGMPKGVGILALGSTTSALGSPNLITHIVAKQELREWTEAFSFPIEEQEQAAGCIYFERLRMVDGKPVFFDITMLPNIGLPRFMQFDLENRSLFDLLRTHYQIVVTGGIQQLFAIRATRSLQKSFNVKHAHPVLQLNRKIDTSREGFHIYSQVFCLTQRYGLVGTF